MERINRLIHFKFFEIAIMILVIVISFPLWKKLNIDETIATAAFYSKAKFSYIEVENQNQGSMFPIKTEEILNTETKTKIKVTNETKTSEEYNLLLKLNKNSTLDYHCLNIALNNEVSTLEEKYYYEDLDNIYFSLTIDTINAECKEYEFLIWLDYDRAENDMQGKVLNYQFELLQGTNL